MTSVLGRWNILSWEQRYDDGRRTYPLGRDIKGFITYQPDGTMFCVIARAGRAALAGSQWTAPEADRAAAYSGYFSYAGPYTVMGDEVVHHVDVSLYPNWEGGDQRRKFVLDGDALDISARMEEGTPEARTAVLSWRRA